MIWDFFLIIIFKVIKILFYLEFYIIILVFILNGKFLNVFRNWFVRVDGVVFFGIVYYDFVFFDGRFCVYKICLWVFYWDCGFKKIKLDILKNIIDMFVL